MGKRANGAKPSTVRGYRASGAYDKAVQHLEAARKAHRGAIAAKDAGRQDATAKALQQAETGYQAANAQRFHSIAAGRANSVVRNLDLLKRLVQQRRYSVTAEHRDIVTNAIREAVDQLEQAFAAAIARSRSSRPRVSFEQLEQQPASSSCG